MSSSPRQPLPVTWFRVRHVCWAFAWRFAPGLLLTAVGFETAQRSPSSTAPLGFALVALGVATLSDLFSWRAALTRPYSEFTLAIHQDSTYRSATWRDAVNLSNELSAAASRSLRGLFVAEVIAVAAVACAREIPTGVPTCVYFGYLTIASLFRAGQLRHVALSGYSWGRLVFLPRSDTLSPSRTSAGVSIPDRPCHELATQPAPIAPGF